MRMRPPLPRCLLLLAILALVASACVAAGAPDDTPGASPTSPASTPATPASASPTPAATPILLTPDEFWASLFYGDVDFAAFPSVAALAGYASAVVVARIGSVDEGPVFEDEFGNLAFRAVVTLDVESILHGTVNAKAPRTIRVLVLLGEQYAGHGPDPWQERLASLKASLPKERGILFLIDETTSWSRSGPPPPAMPLDPTLYSVFASNGFIRDDDGVARPSILKEKAWTRAIDGRPFDDVIAEVAATKPAD